MGRLAVLLPTTANLLALISSVVYSMANITSHYTTFYIINFVDCIDVRTGMFILTDCMSSRCGKLCIYIVNYFGLLWFIVAGYT